MVPAAACEAARRVAVAVPAWNLQAMRLFGCVDQVKEACRDARGAAALDALARDTRYGLRRLVRDWRFLIAVGTGFGLVLSVLAMLALRVSSGNIGIGNIAALAYQPRIDPLALLAIAAVTGVVGVAAAFVPGRRAARMDPLVALRHE